VTSSIFGKWARSLRPKWLPLVVRFPKYRFGRGTYDDGLEIMEWGEGAKLSVGNFCSIAAGVRIFLGGNHRTDWVTTYPFGHTRGPWSAAAGIPGHPATRGDIVIGNDVWIAYGATILSGVSIGDGAVVGAHAVVSRDVPPYAVVVGNPAQVVRHRFDASTIERLLKLRWWDWSDDKLSRLMPRLLSPDIEAFLSEAARSAD
jgi:chloramphenicol O-acetyltransferase type B